MVAFLVGIMISGYIFPTNPHKSRGATTTNDQLLDPGMVRTWCVSNCTGTFYYKESGKTQTVTFTPWNDSCEAAFQVPPEITTTYGELQVTFMYTIKGDNEQNKMNTNGGSIAKVCGANASIQRP